jgi:hypothetical protein
VLAPAAVTSAIFLLKSSGLGPTAEIESWPAPGFIDT